MRTRIALLVVSLVAAPAPTPAQTAVSERAAFRLSLWGTVIPVAVGAAIWATHHSPGDDQMGSALLMSGGFIIGPALGYSAAGLGGRGLRGLGLRFGLTALSGLPAYAMCGWNCSDEDLEFDLASLTIATGAGLSAASAVYDIARVKHNVRRRVATRSGPQLSVAPVYAPGHRGGALGVRLGVTS